MDKIYCTDCKYWMVYDSKPKQGECRRDTPLLSPKGSGVWPTTNYMDFCYSGKKLQIEILNESSEIKTDDVYDLTSRN